MAKGKYQKWLEPESLILLEGWARDGLSDQQIAHNMGVAYSTMREWRDKYPAISASLKKGKEVVDLIVENALYKSATGHVQKIKKPIKIKTEKSVPGKGKIVEEHIEYAEEEVYIPPQNTAQIFWLKNRRPDKWRDKPELVIAEKYEDDGLISALNKQAEDLFEDGDDSGMLPLEEGEE